ncbi:hypothetical protein B2G71_01920 [Novosphingobium sp. PC22D]|uniref:hypothetical protein n=1 Tax=Novosphingobium sp. PC22D TaxID=1962403 RepID=UPI000BF1AC44|nr:hypothetical protein [Novosphingobium sp. PC22D]PEQ14379.1 hypothetical protein B2G71_01920 [Novosphingobium sp. PC22D]
MSLGGPYLVLAIIALCYGGWLINNYIRARHGYALEDEWGGKTERIERSDQALAELREENKALRKRLDAIEQRAAALETIVTDSGYTVAREIDALGAKQPAGQEAAQ